MLRQIRSFYSRKVRKLKKMSQRAKFGGHLSALVQPILWSNHPRLMPLSLFLNRKAAFEKSHFDIID